MLSASGQSQSVNDVVFGYDQNFTVLFVRQQRYNAILVYIRTHVKIVYI